MLLVASETGHVYTFATRKLQPMITSDSGKALIQTCLNSPDPPPGSSGHTSLEQRMNPSGFEETELTYSVGEEDSKVRIDLSVNVCVCVCVCVCVACMRVVQYIMYNVALYRTESSVNCQFQAINFNRCSVVC